MTDVLHVQKRTETGTLRMRRMRREGQIPAVLYGHGAESVALSVPTRDVNAWLRQASHIVQLQGDFTESVVVKEVQWDAFGVDVLHIDFARIDEKESLELELQVELKGDAPGTKMGGIVKHVVHRLTVRGPATQLPDRLELNINQLEVGGALKASDLELPESVELVGESDEVLVMCSEASAAAEESDEASDSPAEPEVIGRKSGEDDESQGES